MTTCPLCGFEFDGTALSCHASCAFNERCAVICCPNCGYQMVDEQRSVMADRLRRWLARRNPPVREIGEVCALTELRPGQTGRVIEIDAENPVRSERLQVLGFVKDAEVYLLQTKPTYIVRVGFTEVSVEQSIGAGIKVLVG
ncbi:MAG: ferrous iron transport protein A [Chloroflexi bacterium]|nr:ferrous iron transport protein A [Chloroflexota bacterium]